MHLYTGFVVVAQRQANGYLLLHIFALRKAKQVLVKKVKTINAASTCVHFLC